MSTIFHITNTNHWKTAQDQGQYDFCALKTEGFIHLSKPDQYMDTANRYFSGVNGLLLLEIDPDKLVEKLVYENTVGGIEEFPHLYGPLNLEAVIKVYELTEAQIGVFQIKVV